jgi:hypothetical protein
MAIGTPWFPAVRVSGASVCAAGRGGGQKLSYVYYEDEPGWRSSAKMLTKDEARRIAADKRKAPGANRGFVRQSSGGPIYFRTPRACTVAIITTDMPAAIRPYSIAVAAENRFIIAFM